jgi:hypothetical protein
VNSSEIALTLPIRWNRQIGKVVGRTTINRYLATLRKALYYAVDPLKLIPSVPGIRLFPKSATCERTREFVFSPEDYQAWIANLPGATALSINTRQKCRNLSGGNDCPSKRLRTSIVRAR